MDISLSSFAKTLFTFYLYFEILNIPHFLLVVFNLNAVLYKLVALSPLVLILFGFCYVVPRSKSGAKSKMNLWIIALVSYVIIGSISSMIYSEQLIYFFQAIPSFARVLLEIFLFYFFLLSLTKEDTKRLLIHLTIAYILLGLSIPLLAYFGISLSEGVTGLETIIATGRPAGLAANANPAAYQATIGVILIIYWLLNDPIGKMKYLLAITLLLQIFCAFFTFSNTGMISIVVVLGFALTKTSFLKAGIYKFVGFFFVLAVIVSQSVNTSLADELSITNLEKLQNFVKLIKFDDNVKFSKRDTKLVTGFQEYSKSPIIGNGLGYFKHKISVHNTYLTILGDSGIIPFLLFLFVFGLLFTDGFLSTNSGLSFLLMASISVFGLFCLTLQNMLDPLQYHFYFLLLLNNKYHFIDPFER